MSDHFLITGAMGCIGAWVTKLLVAEGTRVTVFDLSDDNRRPKQLMSDVQLAEVDLIQGDVTDLDQVRAAVAGKTHIVHLAALQVPFAKANPSLGAAVNVTGTVNVFEAAREHEIDHLIFASSAAVYGHPDNYETAVLPPDALRLPETLYGVYKVANEDTAKVFWNDHRVASIGIRPYTVYGPTRDQGVTAQPTLAIEAAVRAQPYHIGYGGRAGLMYVADVAQTFIDAARVEPHGGETYSMRGDIVAIADFVKMVAELTGTDLITHAEEPLPFPDGTEDGPLQDRLGSVPHTPLPEAVAETVRFFQGRRNAAG